MDEAARRAGADREDLVVAGLDVGHLLGPDLGVVQRRAPVGTALEHGEVAHLVGDGADHLHAGGAGADDGHALARQVERLLGPVVGVERLALELVDALVARQRRRRQQTDRGDQEAAVMSRPSSRCRRHIVASSSQWADSTVAVELHVPAQVELVGDVVQVAQVLGLAGEALLPVPLLEQLLGEGVAVGDALGVEAGARVAVPVPGAAEVVPGLEHRGVHAQLDQPVQLVDAADAGTDDDRLVVRLRRASCPQPCAAPVRRLVAPRCDPSNHHRTAPPRSFSYRGSKPPRYFRGRAIRSAMSSGRPCGDDRS